MKKFLSLALAMVMMCLAAVPAFAAEPTQESYHGATRLVEETTTPPTIDGTLEDVWGDPGFQLTEEINPRDARIYAHDGYHGGGGNGARLMSTIDYYWLWDDEYFYMAFSIVEPKAYNPNADRAYEYGSHTYQWDVKLNGSDSSEDASTRIKVNADASNASFNSGTAYAANEAFEVGFTRDTNYSETNNKIVLELRVPLSATGATEEDAYFDAVVNFIVNVQMVLKDTGADYGVAQIQHKNVPEFSTSTKTYDLFVLNAGEEEEPEEPEDTVVIGPSATPTPGATDNPGVTPGLTPGAPSTLPIPAPSITAASFTDVDEDAWYYEALEYVVDAGLMNGVGNNKFAPAAELDRAMLVTVLWRLAGEPTVNVNTFDDVPYDAWYTSAVNWAAEDGIVKGYAGCFNPTDGITREQVAAILHRFADTMGYKSSDFSNRYYKTSDWAVEDVAWADANGILDIDTNLEDMTEIATRAEIAAMLAKFCQTFVD